MRRNLDKVSTYFRFHPGLALVFLSQTIFLASSTDNAFSQANAPTSTSFRELVTRLPANAKYAISPPSLRGSTVALYSDPQNAKAYYITPMLLPDWGALEAGIKKSCGERTAPTDIHEITVQLEFGRDKIRSEIAEIATRLEQINISKEQIFYYPYAWVSVRTGARAQFGLRSPKHPVRTILEYPADAKNTLEARALRITEPEAFPARISATCEELRFIFDNRDITGTFFSPTKETLVNSFSVEYRNFSRSNQLTSLTRTEGATGAQTLINRSSGKGGGLNIGGHVGGMVRDAESRQQIVDSRARYVSGNLISDAARSFAETLAVRNWIEFQGAANREAMADELTKFVMRNSAPIALEIKRADDKHWTLGNGVLARTLTNQELKQFVESSSKLDIDFSEKATIKCPKDSPYCGGAEVDVDKKFKGVDDNGIKWQQEGAQWIPTSVTLYAVSADKIEQGASASIVEVQAKDGGMLVADLQPVAVDTVPGSDLMDIVNRAVTDLKGQINAEFRKLTGLKHDSDKKGTLAQAKIHRGTVVQPTEWAECQDGEVMYRVQQILDDKRIKTLYHCTKIPALEIK
jgi:hypothetical protein